MKRPTTWLNGTLLLQEEALLPASGAGTLLGWGAFTTLGVWGARPFATSRHLSRLRRDVARCHLELPYSDAQLRDALERVLRDNEIAHGIARMTVTARGDGRWNLESGVDVSVLAQSRPNQALSPLRLMVSPYRVSPRCAMTGVKSTSYGEQLAAWRHAKTHGFDDALLLTSNGCVCEASRANLFWAKNGRLFTPGKSTGCLPGIARALMLEWCREETIPVCESACSLDELLRADEVFVTASTFGARSVSQIENKPFASGELTARLQERWARAVEEGKE